MTCIVGVVHDGEVWIGCDGRASFSYYYHPIAQPKMARVGPMLIGVAGMPRVGQLLFGAGEVPPLGDYAPYDYLCGPFARWAREMLKGEDAMGTEEGDPVSKSHFVIALAGRLFLVDGRFAVYESKRGFEACGTGLEVAFGYLLATPGMEPSQRIQGALQAASEILFSVGPPFHIEKL